MAKNIANLDSVLVDVKIAKSAEVSFNEDAKKAGRKVEVHYEFDASGLTVRQLLERYGLKTAVIDRARALRQADSEDEFKAYCEKFSKENPERVVMTEAGHSPFASKSAPKDPKEAAAKAAARMTPEQRAEFMALLKEMDKK